MIVDYNEKLKDLEEDYGSSIGRLAIAENTINSGLFLINDSDSPIAKENKEKIKSETMIDLGRVIEFGLKYFIKLKRMELFPTEQYDDPTRPDAKGTFKAKMFMNKATINEFLSKALCSDPAVKAEFDAARALDGTGHNFNVSYLLIDKLDSIFGDTKELIGRIALLDKISTKFQEGKGLNLNTIEYIAFPGYFYASVEWGKGKKEIEALERIQSQMKDDIEKNGDVFTKLRYYSNNLGVNNYDYDALLSLAKQILKTNEVVKKFGNDLSANPDIQYAYYKVMENIDLMRFSEDELNQLFNHKKLNKDPKAMCFCLFSSEPLSIEEIFEILSSKEIDEKDYDEIFYHGLSLEEVKYFRALGITSYERMYDELVRGKDFYETMYNKLSGKHKGIDRHYKNNADNFKIDDGSNYKLLKYFEKDSFNEVCKDSEMVKNVKENLDDKRIYLFSNDLFNLLKEKIDLNEVPEIWAGLDIGQLSTYFSSYYMMYGEMITFNKDEIIENIIENVQNFKDNPELLKKLPLMLKPSHNFNMIELLHEKGFDDNKIETLDSTIFCLPTDYLKTFDMIINQLVINGEINPRVLDKMKDKYGDKQYNILISRECTDKDEYIEKQKYLKGNYLPLFIPNDTLDIDRTKKNNKKL